MSRLAIANRGEIARRILRTARRRGCTVAVISTAEDRDAPVRREADAVLEVGSFLDGPAIVAAARAWGADLLHPGYGFLSEQAAFAEAVEAAGIAFVGPTPEAMRALGGKEAAKAKALACGVPVLPALLSHELAALPEAGWGEALASRGLRAPFLVKASGGGGGRGMRIVPDLAQLGEAVRQAAEEAKASFGDGTVFVERFLEAPRHIEAQVFGDGRGGGVFLGERACSLQRRHQKVLEEAPAPALGPELREALGRAALALVRETRYRGAGTVEFLVDAEDRFFFLEVNTRLQVEHPVTEAVLGLDLVDAQLELAEGRWPAALGDPAVFRMPRPKGVALEARVLAEDPRRGFLPTPGPLTVYREPAGPGLRVDSGVQEGGRVNARFDSLIAKLIAWGPDRAEAFRRLRAGLEGFTVQGCATNLPFLAALAGHPEVQAGRIHTGWIAANLEALNGSLLPLRLQALLEGRPVRAALSRALRGGAAPQGPAARFAALVHPDLTVTGRLEAGLRVEARGGPAFRLGGAPVAEALQDGASHLDLTVSRGAPGRLWVSLRGETLDLEDPLAHLPGSAAQGDEGAEVRAPMAGTVVEVRAAEGQTVEEGQVLLVLESMKMLLELAAPRAGRVDRLEVQAGQSVNGSDVVVYLS